MTGFYRWNGHSGDPPVVKACVYTYRYLLFSDLNVMPRIVLGQVSIGGIVIVDDWRLDRMQVMIYVYVCMYLCIYVSMNIYVHACMHVCIYACIYVSMYL